MGSPSTPLGNVEVIATTLYVSDLDKAMAWYEEKLGWRPTMEGTDGDRYATYLMAGTLIVLEPLAAALEPSEPGRESSTINVLIDKDPRQVRDELLQRGVVCSDLVESNFLSFLIRDADGNRFYISRAVSQEARDAVSDAAKGPSPLS
jgi:catechol 2,3-dioxygenase-like lactoylglutathione lyase family enzyme